ncbi:MAG: VCBS repeat-containing protein, partial [Firmicutes bacterium]|nr:VCBS repeat-containing protein [Bacillota bacterium]
MNCRRRVVPVLLCAVLLLSLCGCLSTSMDSLYGLPQISKQYLHLEELAETEISGGSEYSAPTLGAYRQSIQFYDMNGDGADEALAFFRDSAGPYIIIYTERAGGYAAAAKITGEGSAIGAVEYSDLDGDGFTELIVEWQQGGGLRLLCVYSLKDWAVNQLYTAPSSGFKVMDL